MDHEFRVHRRQWICKEHGAVFSSKKTFSDHILEQHAECISPNQLPLLIEMSERPMNEMTIIRCPLCPDERRLMLLGNHIAQHLESIALFVLPLNTGEDNPDDDISGEENSHRVTGRKALSRIDAFTDSVGSFASNPPVPGAPSPWESEESLPRKEPQQEGGAEFGRGKNRESEEGSVSDFSEVDQDPEDEPESLEKGAVFASSKPSVRYFYCGAALTLTDTA